MSKSRRGSLFLASFGAALAVLAVFEIVQASYINVGSPSSGGGASAGATFFSSTTQAGPNDTAAETSLIGTVTGSKTIPANTFLNGQILEVRADGFYSLPATSDALTLKVKCGSTVLASGTFTPGAGVVTNGTFKFDLNLTAIGSGAGGAFITNSIAFLSSGTALTDAAKVLNTANVAFDFTTACAFDVTAQWGAAQVGELITATNAAAWIPGAPVTSVDGATGATLVNRFTIANEGGTGTTVNTLTKFTGAPSTAIISTAGDTGGAVGITVAGAGTAGNATVQLAGGLVSCVFDAATTAGDYVQISATTAGNCHDAGATYPTSGQVVGRVRSTNGGGGTFTMDLFPSEIQTGGGGGGGGFIQTLTAPISGNFTAQNFNTGASVVTTQVNNSTPVTSITLRQHDPTPTNQMAALDRAKIAATFTVTMALSAACVNGIVGLEVTDGTSVIILGYQGGNGFRIPLFSNINGTFSGDVVGPFNPPILLGPLTWFQIQETASNRIYSISSDGITFSQVMSEGNTAHFTTTRYGFITAARQGSTTDPDCQMTNYSFKETNP